VAPLGSGRVIRPAGGTIRHPLREPEAGHVHQGYRE
jgi:hypothetical protein